MEQRFLEAVIRSVDFTLNVMGTTGLAGAMGHSLL